MEKAILKTLIYADIFNYPLKAYEIHKWLIQKESSFQKILKGLEKLLAKKKIAGYKDYFFLKKKKGLVLKRIRSTKVSRSLILKAEILTQVLKIIPWIELVGISGGLAMNNTGKIDDIDLFIITAKGRLWLSRLFSNLLLLPVRRKRNSKKVKGKFCLNVFIAEDNLCQERKDLYTAHEILQMKVIWERGGMYQKFLEENDWVFKYLPNWTVGMNVQCTRYNVQKKQKKGINFTSYILNYTFTYLEKLAKWIQLKYMGQPNGMERIQNSALYFHPRDLRQRVLDEYRLTVLKYRHDT